MSQPEQAYRIKVPLGVYFEGTAEMLTGDDEQYKAFELIKGRMSTGDEILEDAKRDDGHKFYKITVSSWYVFGKLDGERGQKDELKWNGGKK